MPSFQTSTDLPFGRQVVFNCLRRPAHLVTILTASIHHFDYDVPERLDVGSRLQFRLHRFGMKIELIQEVVEFVEYERIVLQQRKGPFRRWNHEFAFAEQAANATRMIERVNFEGPGGFLGLMVTNAKILEVLQKHVPRSHALLREQLAAPGG